VTLNGRTAAAGDKGRMIGRDDVVEIAAGVGRIVPQAGLPLTELASGPGWIAVDKPAGVAVHPLREGETATVLNAVAGRYPQVQGVGLSGGEGGLKSGVVHRLDHDTSGVLLIALDEERWTHFRRAFAEHRTRKIYAAVVDGEVAQDTGYADVWLAVTRHRPAYVRVVDRETPGARRCTLSWEVTGRAAGLTSVDIDLGTGFLHQIRATFRHLGHPVRGDRVYGNQAATGRAGRLLLHAKRLRIDDINLVCHVPDEFAF
ncbi:MAG: RNA pseudouridine synthase, partial [Planctomycetota bacterium]